MLISSKPGLLFWGDFWWKFMFEPKMIKMMRNELNSAWVRKSMFSRFPDAITPTSPKGFPNTRVWSYHQNLDFYFGTTFGENSCLSQKWSTWCENDAKWAQFSVGSKVQVFAFSWCHNPNMACSCAKASPKGFPNTRVWSYHQNLDFYLGTSFAHKLLMEAKYSRFEAKWLKMAQIHCSSKSPGFGIFLTSKLQYGLFKRENIK